MSFSPFVLAVPSKGRLQENAQNFFARAGLAMVQARGARDYRGALEGLPGVEVAYLSASDITSQLAAGTAHLGITGEDLVRENVPDADAALLMLAPLGFGHANVVVAVPKAWIDVRTMSDLEDVAHSFRARRGERMRVATKYPKMTRRFFGEHGIGDYRIVESLGATEGAPAAGQAELIVDITTTGATLSANGLKVLEDGVMLKSEANLVASVRADWSGHKRGLARNILARISAEEEARTTREFRVHGPVLGAQALAEAAELFGAQARGNDGGRLTLLSARTEVAASLADWLIGKGADHVSVAALGYVFGSHNPLNEKLLARIGPVGAGSPPSALAASD